MRQQGWLRRFAGYRREYTSALAATARNRSHARQWHGTVAHYAPWCRFPARRTAWFLPLQWCRHGLTRRRSRQRQFAQRRPTQSWSTGRRQACVSWKLSWMAQEWTPCDFYTPLDGRTACAGTPAFTLASVRRTRCLRTGSERDDFSAAAFGSMPSSTGTPPAVRSTPQTLRRHPPEPLLAAPPQSDSSVSIAIR